MTVDADPAQQLAAAVGQNLPAEYLAFLDGLPARPTLGPAYGPILDFGGREWRPYDRGRLAELAPCGRRETPVPNAHRTVKEAADIRAADATQGGTLSAELAEQGFSLDRLAGGFCIGDDGNREPVFVDPATGGVYVYYHDGMSVEPLAGSLAELVASSRDRLGDEDGELG